MLTVPLLDRLYLKGIVERALGAGPVGRLRRRLLRGHRLILAWHNVYDDAAAQVDGGELSLHVPFSRFCQQLDVIARVADVVPLARMLAPGRDNSRPAVALTFDDAYRGAVNLAIPEIVRRRYPATMFVTPGLLGRQSAWWDRCAPASGSWLPADRSACLERLQGRETDVVEWAAEHGRLQGRVDPNWAFATEAELTVMASLPGVTLGAHSWSHCNLQAVDAAESRHEVEGCLAWLFKYHPEKTVRWLAYPYGCRPPDAQTLIHAAGLEGACLVSGGWFHPSRTARDAVPRLCVGGGLSGIGLLARLSGFRTT